MPYRQFRSITRIGCAGVVLLGLATGIAPIAHADGGPTLASAALAGPLRAGASFAQTLLAAGSGLNVATMAVVVESDSDANPGAITATSLTIIGTDTITGQLGAATATGVYALSLCVTPVAQRTCTAALARRAFTVRVAGAPVRIAAEPALQSAQADEAASFQVSLYDAGDRLTQLAATESVVVGAVASDGASSVTGVDTPGTGLVARLRRAGTGFFALSGDTPGASVVASVAPVAFVAGAVDVTLALAPPPHDIAVIPDRSVRAAAPSTAVVIAGFVRDGSGAPLAGATVTGAVASGGATTSATSGGDGSFEVSYTSASALGEQRVTLSASKSAHGTDTADIDVHVTANGRTPINDLRLNGVPAADFTAAIDAPTSGTATAPTTAVEVAVVAVVPGDTVTFTAPGGRITAADSAAWATGSSTLDVVSDPLTGRAVAWMHAEEIGAVTVTAAAATDLRGVVAVSAGAPRMITATARRTAVSGDRVTITVRVEDAFDNPVPGARVDLVLTRTSSGTFAGGYRQVTVRTAADGSAAAVVATSPRDTAPVVVSVRGDAAACTVTNQFSCPAGQPGAGFPAASGPVRIETALTPPTVRVTGPKRDAPVSTNQFITVRATTTGIPGGSPVRILEGEREMARGEVRADGSIRIDRVRAVGDGVFVVAVSGIRVRSQVRVLPFGITRAEEVDGRLALTVAVGAWDRGTTIAVLRGSTVVQRVQVARMHQDLRVRLPYRTGSYQVQVNTADGAVPGARRVTVG